MLSLGFIISCENPLDRGPLGIISEDNVWSSQDLLDLYLGNLYARCEFSPGASGDKESPDVGLLVANASAAGYCRTYGPWPTGYKFTQGFFTNQGTDPADILGYWKYDLVRDINVAIQKLEDPISNLDQVYKDAALGQLHFLRAWVYFQMVIRYGGVPIILKPQSIETPADQLSIPRSSEQEVYDLIGQECDKSQQLLVGKTMDYGKATSWAALALKSRAMMYAGSIGLFGTMQLDGLLGINDPDLNYYKMSYDASKKIISEGGFELYGMGSSDPVQSYYDLFTRAERNNETILAEVFDGEGGKAEDWERWCAPALVDGTTFMNTYLETYEMYENTDGSSGKVDRSTLVAGVFHNMADFIGKKDPRFRANTFYPECTYMGKTVYMHEGMYVDGVYHTSNVEGLDIPSQGPHRDIGRTGFFNKKRSNEDYDVHSLFNLGGTDYMIFRLGEIYLNLAEAAYALGKDQEALDALNMVRRRVNMPDKTTIDWTTIQNERKVELCFENQHYWDVRRWRIAEKELDSSQRTFTGVTWRKDYSNPGMYEIILHTTGNATDPWPRIFKPNFYYFPITLARIQNDPSLVENPGYEN